MHLCGGQKRTSDVLLYAPTPLRQGLCLNPGLTFTQPGWSQQASPSDPPVPTCATGVQKRAPMAGLQLSSAEGPAGI